MKIRELNRNDLFQVDRLHTKFFPELEYPDFLGPDYKCPFVVTDDENRIITAGGIKLLPEIVLVTDKSVSVKVRYDALLQALGSAIHIGKDMKVPELFTLVFDDDNYVRILQRRGFKLMRDTAILTLNLGE